MPRKKILTPDTLDGELNRTINTRHQLERHFKNLLLWPISDEAKEEIEKYRAYLRQMKRFLYTVSFVYEPYSLTRTERTKETANLETSSH